MKKITLALAAVAGTALLASCGSSSSVQTMPWPVNVPGEINLTEGNLVDLINGTGTANPTPVLVNFGATPLVCVQLMDGYTTAGVADSQAATTTTSFTTYGKEFSTGAVFDKYQFADQARTPVAGECTGNYSVSVSFTGTNGQKYQSSTDAFTFNV